LLLTLGLVSWKCIFNFYFEDGLRNYKGNLESMSLFWSYKALKLTLLHLNYLLIFFGWIFICLCEYTISNENHSLYINQTNKHVFWQYFVCLFYFEFYLATVAITCDKAANLDLCIALTAFSRGGSFTCHTYCDTGPPFLRQYPKDPWFSLLNAELLAKEQSLPIWNVLGLTRPAWVGLELTTYRLLSESTTTTNDTCKLDTNSDLFALDIRKNSYCRNILNKTTHQD
jgi:hypothetical protein